MAMQTVQHVHKARHERVCSLYSRDADLKQVVLDELFPEHRDAELNAELHEAAAVSALIKHIKTAVIPPLQSIRSAQNARVRDSYLLHAIGLEHVEITAWTATEPVRKHTSLASASTHSHADNP